LARPTKLELTWIGKENRPKLEPRILIEDPAKSYHAPFRASDRDLFDNRLIFGDNLLALKALEQEFAGKIKCIYIDPPYNTGSAFTHYDDGVEHSLWLSLIRDRLEILRRLLADDGSIWITLDDNEHAYCKVMGDEVFGRANFVASLCWQKKVSPANDAKWFSGDHDHLLVFARDKSRWRPHRLPHSEAQKRYYTNPDNDPRGPWNSAAYTCAKSADERPNLYYPIVNPNTGEEIWPRKTRVWAYEPETHKRNEVEGLIYWGKDGSGAVPRMKKFLGGRDVVPRSVWGYDEAGHTQEAMMESLALFGATPFSTPKPERLLRRVLMCATTPGDLVLDSFAGSGTTGAVAHKMGRRWIMVELGEHCHTHILPRLKKVVDGEDKGGITEAVNWKGGGGFRYCRLAPSLLQKDQFDNWVINRKYDAAMLAEAICKLEGFAYAPSDTVYWQHGRSTEKDFIYITTQTLTREQIQRLSDEVGEDRSLLVMCGAFRVKSLDEFPNLTVKKIPKAVLARCEWGHDDYSLEIKNLPLKSAEEGSETLVHPSSTKPRSKAERRDQATLFDMDADERSTQ
jgi:adenine-specific DNA-methyltransferase